MARIHPFQAVRYTARAGDASALVTQPYDKIPDELRERYLAASPYNFVRLIKGMAEPGDDDGDNVYTRAAALLEQWLAEGILAADPSPALYPYFQEFAHPDTGDRLVRKAFVCLLDLEDYDRRVVHRHELTHRGPKVDRLRLTEATRAYFGQLFFLYDEPEATVDALLDQAAAGPPLMQAEEEGVTHTLWRIDDPLVIETVQRAIAERKLLIADGHHRYETALAYRDAHPEEPGGARVMVSLVNLRSPGLVVLATHRPLEGLDGLRLEDLLERAGRRFDVERLESAEVLRERLDDAPPEPAAIGMVFHGEPGAWLFTARPDDLAPLLADQSPAQRKLDVVALHQALLGDALGITEEDVRELKGISYIRGFQQAVDAVRTGGKQVAFLLRPVDAAEVAEIAFAGGVMPQKSTDFYPKLLSGFATYRFGSTRSKAPRAERSQ